MIKRFIKIVVTILLASTSNAQDKITDSLYPIHEFVELRQIYNHLPITLKIHIISTSSGFSSRADSINTDMEVYYDYHNFYMKSEGLEEIANDSLIVMVNNPAKNILLYRNNRNGVSQLGKSLLTILPDSSVDLFAKKYFSSISSLSKDKNIIELKSRDVVYSTGFPKESLSVKYSVSTHQPIEIIQTRTLLKPIDSITYNNLSADSLNYKKLISTTTPTGSVFFSLEQKITVFRFDKIDYGMIKPPVTETDKIIKKNDDEYIPVKEFEGYILTKEF